MYSSDARNLVFVTFDSSSLQSLELGQTQIRRDLCVTIDLGNVGQEVEDTAGVTPLVVVPGNKLDEVVVERDTGLGVEDGGLVGTAHVGGNDLVLGVTENALKLTLGSVLEGLLDGLVGSGLLEADGKVDNGDVGGGDTHGHTGELAVKLRDDLADSLGGTGAAGNDVLGSSTATAPVLAGGTVDGLLSGGVGVDGGHETLNDTELVVDDLGEGSKAVGGARGVGKDLDVGLVGLLVDTHDEHGGVSRGSGDDDLLGATLQVKGGLLVGGEDTGGLDDVVGAGLSPGDVGGVSLGVEGDLLAVDDQVLAGDLDGTLELAVDGVVLEHVGSVLGLNEGVVDSNNVDVVVLDGIAEDNATNATEAVNTNLWNGSMTSPR